MQINFPEALLTGRREVLVAALAPFGPDAVSLQDGHLPGLLEGLQRFAGFVA